MVELYMRSAQRLKREVEPTIYQPAGPVFADASVVTVRSGSYLVDGRALGNDKPFTPCD